MNPLYHQAKFILSAPDLNSCPTDTGREVAFAGRSNAGKSSALNTLSRQKSLARTSKTPGRTQLLNFFNLNEQQRFVDLPGYGYAKVPERIKQQWHLLMESYLRERESLYGIILVMDIRHPLTEFDWQMIEWCAYSKKPLHLLLTKADKFNYGAAKNTLFKVQRELEKQDISVTLQMFSALKKTGVDDIHQLLDSWFQAE
ncbi:GTP-binding protein [Bathymodiolus japonicus methanotrophic gill symbiont]|uniref:ribosome biogenesis GTP-binding protein YihA/YsxC n=1 Tax=Bathymodiolus japonicus methanotrophic gill symbiont TaxID=113269 RepID=UPI001B6EB5F5|nr:ribosome biogenesis GTP-binding protein YihA/YsxC [Bathymodiolus japonicus methanotrophic gill symbiont]GFO71458.1 GTP-binding protein [Bathymodiolus japonicus methanotrophic gill symbiont]